MKQFRHRARRVTKNWKLKYQKHKREQGFILDGITAIKEDYNPLKDKSLNIFLLN